MTPFVARDATGACKQKFEFGRSRTCRPEPGRRPGADDRRGFSTCAVDELRDSGTSTVPMSSGRSYKTRVGGRDLQREGRAQGFDKTGTATDMVSDPTSQPIRKKPPPVECSCQIREEHL